MSLAISFRTLLSNVYLILAKMYKETKETLHEIDILITPWTYILREQSLSYRIS